MVFGDKQIHLIETAERLFAEKGYAETSIRDIAKEASVNSAMISYYFGSKENLIKAILDYRTTNLTNLFGPVKPAPDNPLEKMLSFVNFFVDKVFEQKHFYQLLFQLQLTAKDDSLLDYYNSLRHKNYEFLKAMFDTGAANCTFQEEIDISFLTSTLSGTINHIVLNQKFYRQVNNLEGMPEKEFLKSFKKGIKGHLEKIIKGIIKHNI
jgi:AcrR family transcriptional regulator